MLAFAAGSIFGIGAEGSAATYALNPASAIDSISCIGETLSA